jgi:HAD superfamily hydrolase (TIGR01450 family)
LLLLAQSPQLERDIVPAGHSQAAHSTQPCVPPPLTHRYCSGSVFAPMESAARKERLQAASELLASTDNFVFDCDGVLYHPEGAVEGAAETLASLRAAGKRCFFVTNNSTATRQQLQTKLKAKGIDADLPEIFGSAYITACYLRQKAERGEFSGKVYVSGSEALAEEIRSATGLTVLGGAADNDKLGSVDPAEMAAVAVDPEIKAVVVGMDAAGFCYYKVAFSCRCIVENAGCEFINTNPVRTAPPSSLLYHP